MLRLTRDEMTGDSNGPGRTSLRAAALAALLALAACSSPDYTHARQTRFDRPYRGGAANVPEDGPAPAPECRGRPDDVDALAFLAVLAVVFTHGVDYIGHPPIDRPPPPPPPSK